MILKLNTSICPIVCIGTYGTTLSPDFMFESEQREWEEALKEGRITKEELEQLSEAAWRGFNSKRYLDELGRYALHEIEGFLKDISEHVKAGLANNEYSTYSPREYNFSTDGMDYYVSVEQGELDRLANELWSDSDFMDWAYDAYRSRSGFISFMPCTRNEFNEAIKGKDVERAFSMYLMWLLEKEYLDEHGYENPYQHSLLDRFSGNHSEGEFVDDELYHAIKDKIWRLENE